MTHYLLTVHGPAEMDEYGNYGSKEDMEEAFAATGASMTSFTPMATGSSPVGFSRHRPRPSSTARVRRR